MHSPFATPELQIAMLFAALVGVLAAFRQHRRDGESNDELTRLFLWHVGVWTVILAVIALVEVSGAGLVATLMLTLFLVLIVSIPITLPTYLLARYVLRKRTDHQGNA